MRRKLWDTRVRHERSMLSPLSEDCEACEHLAKSLSFTASSAILNVISSGVVDSGALLAREELEFGKLELRH